MQRGAANAMIKNIGALAGLRFEEPALEAISSFCSDMPFWIRKACSSIHGKIETAIRPVTLQEPAVSGMLEAYGRDEGRPSPRSYCNISSAFIPSSGHLHSRCLSKTQNSPVA